MAKKASVRTAINTTAPLYSCRFLLAALQVDMPFYNQMQAMWTLPQYISALQQHHVSTYLMREALSGRITSLEDARILLITDRLLK